MRKLILRRILQAIPMLIFISIVSFILIKIAPGDPVASYITPKMSERDVEIMRHNLGLDKPVYIQYFIWLQDVLKGNFGYSLVNHRPILKEITTRIPATLILMGTSLSLSIILAIPLGLIAGLKKNSILDNIISVFTYIGISIPSFWFAMILIYTFSLSLHLLPSFGMHAAGTNSTIDVIKHLIMPSLVLSFYNLSVFIRYIRSNTISELREDYVTLHYANGASKIVTLFKYVLKNTLIPIITILGMSIPGLISGAFITETIFGWPGMGRLGINAIYSFDYPMIMGITLLSSLMLILGNLVSDILCFFVDPRIKDMG